MSVIAGYYFLHMEETELYTDILKDFEKYEIQTYTGRKIFTGNLSFTKIDGTVFLKFDSKKIPVYQIKSVNGIDINAAVINKEINKCHGWYMAYSLWRISCNYLYSSEGLFLKVHHYRFVCLINKV
ncbi:MAG: hypothetical protein Q9M89_03030 [Persephonella sp.]|nr:hypothetical protein [Persephonella sp.]